MFAVLAFLFSAPIYASQFSVESVSIKEGATLSDAQVFQGMGCKGKNLSPQLSWKNPPSGTQSFVITMFDPDAPTGGSGWWHWTVGNIPASVNSIPEGASGTKKMPKGSIEGRTDFGKSGFGGACPPPGDKPHRYVITVYAIKTPKLDLSQDSSGALVGYLANQNALGKAVLTTTYSR